MPDANSYRHSNPLNRKPKVTFREKLRLFQIKKGRFIFSFYSDSGFCAVRPVRLDRSVKAFLH
ncbi:hypothetical protein B5F99_02440 [Odoribacter splanchnicus]|nr:hypothetical protein B5F99_02440 [Odoribacter splanchnicus]